MPPPERSIGTPGVPLPALLPPPPTGLGWMCGCGLAYPLGVPHCPPCRETRQTLVERLRAARADAGGPVAEMAAPAPIAEERDTGPRDTDPRARGLADRLAVGEELSGAEVAAELDVSERTGRRLLKDARGLPSLDSVAPAALHLVTVPDLGTAHHPDRPRPPDGENSRETS